MTWYSHKRMESEESGSRPIDVQNFNSIQLFANIYEMKIRIAICFLEYKNMIWNKGNFLFMHHHLHQKCVHYKYRQKQANCGDFFFIAAKLVTKELYLWEVAPAEYKIKQMQVDLQTLGIFYAIFVVEDFLNKQVYMKRIAWLLAKPYL